MTSISRFIFLLFFTFIATSTSHAEDTKTFEQNAINKPMQFINAYNGGNCLSCEWIAAEGIITADTPQKFKQFLTDNYRNSIILNSAGGNLKAALELGKIIHQHKLDTEIGKTWLDKNSQSYKDGFQYHETSQGICTGACAYAFLGGIMRAIPADSFGLTHQADAKDALAYLAQMNVKPELFSILINQPPSVIYFPTSAQLIRAGIDNSTDLFSDPALIAFGKNGKVVETLHLSGYYATPQNPTSYRLYCRENVSHPHFTIIQNHTGDINKSDPSDPSDPWSDIAKLAKTANLRYNSGDFNSVPVKVTAYFNGKNSKAIAFELLGLSTEKFKDITSLGLSLDNIPRPLTQQVNVLQAEFGNVSSLLATALQNCVE